MASMNDDDFKQEVMRTLGRVEQKIDGHLAQFNVHVDDDEKYHVLVNNELEGLKIEQAKRTGALKVLASVGSIFGAIVGSITAHFVTKGIGH